MTDIQSHKERSTAILKAVPNAKQCTSIVASGTIKNAADIPVNCTLTGPGSYNNCRTGNISGPAHVAWFCTFYPPDGSTYFPKGDYSLIVKVPKEPDQKASIGIGESFAHLNDRPLASTITITQNVPSDIGVKGTISNVNDKPVIVVLYDNSIVLDSSEAKYSGTPAVNWSYNFVPPTGYVFDSTITYRIVVLIPNEPSVSTNVNISS